MKKLFKEVELEIFEVEENLLMFSIGTRGRYTLDPSEDFDDLLD